MTRYCRFVPQSHFPEWICHFWMGDAPQPRPIVQDSCVVDGMPGWKQRRNCELSAITAMAEYYWNSTSIWGKAPADDINGKDGIKIIICLSIIGRRCREVRTWSWVQYSSHRAWLTWCSYHKRTHGATEGRRNSRRSSAHWCQLARGFICIGSFVSGCTWTTGAGQWFHLVARWTHSFSSQGFWHIQESFVHFCRSYCCGFHAWFHQRKLHRNHPSRRRCKSFATYFVSLRHGGQGLLFCICQMMGAFFMKASVMRTADILSRRLSNVYFYSMEHYSKNSMWTWLFLGETPPPIQPGSET